MGESVDAVTAAIHRPAAPRLPPTLLVPGAGGDLDSVGLVALAEVVAAAGGICVRANLPYRESGRPLPPRAEASVASLQAVAAAVHDLVDADQDWVVGGRSYGGRVASMAHADGLSVAGLVLVAYPLHPPGRPEAPRVAHWPAITAPCLFLQGGHDPFCKLDVLTAELPQLTVPTTVEVVEGGDHDLRVPVSAGGPVETTEVVAARAAVVARWLDSIGGGGV